MDLQNVKKGAFWAARPRQYNPLVTLSSVSSFAHQSMVSISSC